MTAFAQLKSVDDPRDRLDKAMRHELAKFAAAHGVTEIEPAMPAILMRQILRQKGLTNIKIPNRELGRPYANSQAVVDNSPANVKTTDATSDLMRQWKEEKKETPTPTRNYTEFTALRMKAKSLGIKLSRTDNMATVKEKLAKHGQDAS